MAVTSGIRTERRRGHSGVGEAIVLASMATVAAVIGAVLVVQIGTPTWVAFAVAAMFLGAVLAAHVLVRRSEQLRDLRADMARLDDRLGRAMSAGPHLDKAVQRDHALPAGVGSAPAAPGAIALGSHSARPANSHNPGLPFSPTNSTAAPQRTARGVEPKLEPNRAEQERRIAPELSVSAGDKISPSVGERVAPMLAAGAASIPATADHSVAGNERALKMAATPAVAKPAANSGPVTGSGPVTRSRPAFDVSPVSEAPAAIGDEGDYSIDELLAETTPRPPIDDLLKRLAGDISAGVVPTNSLSSKAPSAGAPEGFARYAPMTGERVDEAATSAPWTEPVGLSDGPRKAMLDDDMGIGGTDVSGLAPSLMHETVARADAVVTGSTEAIAAEGKMAAIVDALSNERLELVLEPIIGFESLAAEHFDVTVRLRQSDGQPLAIESEDEAAARGMGLLALLDTVKIVRTKRLMTQSMADGSERVLSTLDAHTLQNDQFHEDVADLASADRTMIGRLVLTFRQSDVRAFAPVEWQALARLSAIGFHFGIDSITDLDMDFGELYAGGFVFARLDADVFLDGMMVAGGEHVSPADVCRHLTENGLGLVVRRIDDPKRLARVMGFGVTMGQGAMFAAGVRSSGMGSPSTIGQLRIDT